MKRKSRPYVPSGRNPFETPEKTIHRPNSDRYILNSRNSLSFNAFNLNEVGAQSAFRSPNTPKSSIKSHRSDLETISSFPLKSVWSNVQKSTTRVFPTEPSLILDAPGCRDDYYAHLLDWNSKNQLIAGLDKSVYSWTPGSPVSLVHESQLNDHVNTCVFSQSSHKIAIASQKDSNVYIYNSDTNLRNSVFNSEIGVAAVCWTNPSCFLVGDTLGGLQYFDLRSRVTGMTYSTSHRDRIVGMAVSPDSNQICTGGNGHIVNLYDVRNMKTPVHEWRHHKSAVRAIGFCPFSSIVATGGGRNDGSINLLSTTTGKIVETVQTETQVCFLKWARQCHEFVCGNERNTNQLSVYAFGKSAVRIGGISKAHFVRPMYAALSPDGSRLATMAGSGDQLVSFFAYLGQVLGNFSGCYFCRQTCAKDRIVIYPMI